MRDYGALWSSQLSNKIYTIFIRHSLAANASATSKQPSSHTIWQRNSFGFFPLGKHLGQSLRCTLFAKEMAKETQKAMLESMHFRLQSLFAYVFRECWSRSWTVCVSFYTTEIALDDVNGRRRRRRHRQHQTLWDWCNARVVCLHFSLNLLTFTQSIIIKFKRYLLLVFVCCKWFELVKRLDQFEMGCFFYSAKRSWPDAKGRVGAEQQWTPEFGQMQTLDEIFRFCLPTHLSRKAIVVCVDEKIRYWEHE